MAHVDIDSGKIYGCKEGSFIWWHEKGHLEYAKKDYAEKNNWTMQTCFVYSVIFLVLTQFFPIVKWISLSFMVLAIAFFLSEEIWCWIYAVNEKYLNKDK